MNRHVYFRQQEKNELYHHGIKGQKWGVRRYQNPDGSLTAEGRKRYGKFSRQEVKSLIEQAQDATYEQQETNSTIWELNEFGRRSPSYINNFIDACYDIKKE